MKPDLQSFVDRLTTRSRLKEAEQQALLGLPARLSEVDAHRDVVRLGETVDHLCVVVDGVLARFGQNAEGGRQIIALHIAGDAPDLHLVVVPKETVPMQALTNTTILRVPHAALRALAARYPAIAEAFWRHCSVDAAITAKWVVNLGRHDTKTRIAHLLCEMAVRYRAEADSGEVTFAFALTQTHISDATGVTPVHINRIVKALKEDGLAIVAERTVHIPDWGKLVKSAEFDGAYLRAGLQAGESLRIVA